MFDAVISEVSSPEPPQRSVRVLIVDNDAPASVTLRRSLHLNGYRVHAVNDSHLALAAARGFEPHVVVIEAPTPALHKQDMAWEFASSAELPDTRLVISNGCSVDGDRRKPTRGAVPIVHRPSDLDALLRLIEAHTSFAAAPQAAYRAIAAQPL